MRSTLLKTIVFFALTQIGAKAGPPPGMRPPPRIPILITDGRNNHNWEATTDALYATLMATGRFEVKVESAPEQRRARPELTMLRRWSNTRALRSAIAK